MEIQIKSPNGVKLLTSKKYCPEDIEVVPALQDKSVTPGAARTVTADTDYAGLGTVTVAAVETESGAATPSAAAQVITPSEGKLFDKFTVNATPTETKSVTPTTTAQTVTPTAGKFLSSVSVGAIGVETKTVTPTAAAQDVTPSAGKYLSKVTVNATPTETKTIDANGTFTPSAGKFFSSVTVNVNEQKPEQEKSINVTTNGTETVTPDEGYALSKVTVDVNVDTAKPEQTKSADITSMSPLTVTPDTGKVLTSVTVTPKAPLANTADATAAAVDMLSGKTAYVNGAKVTGTIPTETEYTHTVTGNSVIGVTGKYMADDITITVPKQTKTVTPKATAQTVSPDTGYAGLSSVTVNAAPLDAAQTVTAGTAAKTVSPTGSNIGLASVKINPTPSESKGGVPSTVFVRVLPSEGKLLSYVDIAPIETETKSATPTKAAQTITPADGKYLTSVTVNAIPDAYIIPSGSKTITANGTVDVTAVASAVVNVPAPDLSDATATAASLLLGATAYTGAGKITGTIPTYTGLIRPEDPTMPNKGDIITMDSRQYRVLKTSGKVAEVLCMYDASSPVAFDPDLSDNTYANKNIDTYCNNTFYSGLSSAMKSAIVDKTFTQDSWIRASSVPTQSHYTGKYGSDTYYMTITNAAYGTSITRHCYCLSVQDVLDYLECTTSMGTSDTTLTNTNIWQMFWNTSTSQNNFIWLRSAASTDYANYVCAFDVGGSSGSLDASYANRGYAARPAFQIDLSKVEWTK